MRLGVMSDTHGNLENMRRAAARMIDEFKVDEIIHLGDDMSDAQQMGKISAPLTCIPGVFEQTYQNPEIPHRYIIKLGGVKVLLSHTPKRDTHDLPGDIDPERAMKMGRATIFFHGHTHVYKMEKMNRGVVINPGHLKSDDNRGRPPSFAIVDLEPSKVRAQIIEFDGGLLDEEEFTFS